MPWKEFWGNGTPADPMVVTIAPAADDFLIGSAVTDNSAALTLDTIPSGWEQRFRSQVTTDGQTHQVIDKKASGSETSVSFDSTDGNLSMAFVASFSGVDNTTPLDITPVTFSSNTAAANTDISLPSPVTDGCDIVFIQAQDNGNSNYAFTFSTISGTTGAWTTRVDQNSGFFNQALGSAVQDTAGAITARCASTSGGRSGILYALRPAAAVVANYSDLGSRRNRPGRGPYSTGRYLRPSVDMFSAAAASTVYSQSVAGALSFASSGVKSANKVLTGALSFAGSAVKQTAKIASGVLTFAGALSTLKNFVQAVSGSLSFSSSTVKLPAKLMTGALSFAGVVAKLTSKLVAGSLTFGGAISSLKVFIQAVGGTLSFASGTVVKSSAKALVGVVSFSAAAAKITSKNLAGALTFAGAAVASLVGGLVGALLAVVRALPQLAGRVKSTSALSGRPKTK